MKIGLPLRDKLLLGFSVMVVLALILAYIGMFNLKQTDNFSEKMMNTSLPRINSLYQIRDSISELQVVTNKLASSNETEKAKHKDQLTQIINQIGAFKESYQKVTQDNVKTANFSLGRMNELYGKVFKQITTPEQGNQSQALTHSEEEFKNFVTLMIDDEVSALDTGETQTKHILSNMYQFTLWFSIITVLFGLLLSLFLSRVFSRSIVHLKDKTNAAMSGKKIVEAASLPIYIQDEFDDLADNFVKMMNVLQQKEEKLRSLSVASEKHVALHTQALEESAALYKNVFETIHDGILIVDASGKVVLYNQKFLEIWELPQQMIEVGKAQNLMHLLADQVNDIQQFITRVEDINLHPDQPSIDELKFRDGRTVKCKSQPQLVNETVAGRIWIYRDISDQKQLEEKLKKNEERSAMVEKIVNETVWDWDLKSNIMLFNENLQKLCGSDKSDKSYPLRWWQENVHPEDRDRVLTSLHSLLKSDKTAWDCEFRFSRQDNSYAQVLGRAYILRNEEGVPYRVIGIMIEQDESWHS